MRVAVACWYVSDIPVEPIRRAGHQSFKTLFTTTSPDRPFVYEGGRRAEATTREAESSLPDNVVMARSRGFSRSWIP